MRYVLVAVVRGPVGEKNNALRKEVREKFGAKSSTLPAHFTIKAPFENEEEEMEKVKKALREFVAREKAEPYQIKGYSHFDRRVIFMDVAMSKEAKAVHDRLIDLLETFPEMQCGKKDGKDKKFHVTVASKRIQPMYEELWEHVQQYPCEFTCSFDNISLYRWGTTKWVLEEAFELTH